MDKNSIKKRAIDTIEENSSKLIQLGRDIFGMPETGYREVRTSQYMQSFFNALGLKPQTGIAITGMKAMAPGRSSTINVGVCGELDALLMPKHPSADKETGAAHVCGHHCQLAMLAGVALGLVGTGLIKELDGNLSFLVVPAEESIELDFRAGLIKSGKIKYIAGKQNFIHYGTIDDIDCILCSHLTSVPHKYFDFGKRYNGNLKKQVRFIGKSAHSAMSPDLTINALHAAVCAINNINALRETFRDDNHIRVHYIITRGGLSVNIIPDDVRMEMGVRGLKAEAIADANRKVNEAINAGAKAIGAQVEIIDYGASFPFVQDEKLSLLFAENAVKLVGEENVDDNRDMVRASSTDAGDFSTLKPTIHPNFGGAKGKLHGQDFRIDDEYLTYVLPSKAYALTIIDLLWDGAKKGKEIINSYTPIFKNKDEYDKFAGSLISDF